MSLFKANLEKKKKNKKLFVFTEATEQHDLRMYKSGG